MGYASDDSLEPRAYNPRLAAALTGVTLKNYLDAKNGTAKKPEAQKADHKKRMCRKRRHKQAT